MSLVVIGGYLLGALLGYGAARGERFATVWRHFIRAQLLCVSAVLSFLAAWRLAGLADLIWPLLVTAIAIGLVGIAYLLTPASPDRSGRAVLRGWAAIPNPGFWVIPVATAIAGPAGGVISILIDRIMIFAFGFFVWVLRRNAPIKQQVRTSWIDQAPLIALILGLILNYFTDAPAWTATLLQWAAPLLAVIGAAMFVGSVLHPSQRIPWKPGIRVWAILSLTRIVVLVPLAFFAPNPAIAIALVLCAFTIPTFYPPQLSVLYGYADSVVAAASRWGWFLAPIGLVISAVVIQT